MTELDTAWVRARFGVADPEDGVVRASMVHYNTLAEVDRLVGGLEEVLG